MNELQDGGHGPAKLAEQRELRSRVLGALGLLSEDHREIVVLHEIQGLTYSECAGVLGIPVGTVKSRLSNAFCRLRSSLGGYVLSEEFAGNTRCEHQGPQPDKEGPR